MNPLDCSHPRSLFVAENRILPVVDRWLTDLSSRNLDRTLEEILAQAALDDDDPPDVRRARVVAEEARTKLDRYMNAIEKGMDPSLYVARSRVAQEELAAAQAIIACRIAATDAPLTEEQLRGLLERVGGIVGLLDHADPDERRSFYQELGLSLAYQRLSGQELVRASLGVEFLRVGGGT